MKKSRIGKAILFLLFLVSTFTIVALLLTPFSDDDDESEPFLSGVFKSEKKIAVIPIEGVIESSDRVLKLLKRFTKRSSIKAIVLRINSPGGAVAPAQEIFAEIGKVRAKKPVVASMETVGASAAYYIASNCDKVICSRGTITGSIGVIMVLAEAHKIIQQIGVTVNVIKAGERKDIGSGVRPLTEEERRILESFAKEVHEQFISDVLTGRKGKIADDQLRLVADGSFFTGQRAKELGLVDEIGNFYDAVKAAAKLAKIEGDPELVYPKKKWDSYLDLLLNSLSNAIVRALERSSLIQAVPSIR
jgi:protease-4